jgi:hypothetical protein
MGGETMTPDQINRAIAEACGRKGQALYPDYYHDLNAMADAEKTLDDGLASIYTAWIFRLNSVEPDTIFAADIRKVFCATAAQRAEAFVLTLGLGKEKP